MSYDARVEEPRTVCGICYHEIVPEDERCNCADKARDAEIERLKAILKQCGNAIWGEHISIGGGDEEADCPLCQAYKRTQEAIKS
jgi:hypothetical protein